MGRCKRQIVVTLDAPTDAGLGDLANLVENAVKIALQHAMPTRSPSDVVRFVGVESVRATPSAATLIAIEIDRDVDPEGVLVFRPGASAKTRRGIVARERSDLVDAWREAARPGDCLSLDDSCTLVVAGTLGELQTTRRTVETATIAPVDVTD